MSGNKNNKNIFYLYCLKVIWYLEKNKLGCTTGIRTVNHVGKVVFIGRHVSFKVDDKEKHVDL